MSTVESGATEAELLFAGPGEVRGLCRAQDWAATPLGPVEGWPQSLRTAVCLCQSAGLPMMVMWGADLVQIYNDAFVRVLGGRHPAGLGQAGRDCWPELWEMIGPMYRGVLDTGVPVFGEDLLFTPTRNGYPEEAWFTFSYSAILDDGYRPAGIFVATVETTTHVRARSARGSELELANERLRTQAAELQAQAEELQATAAALAESEMRLRFAFTVADLGPWDLDLVRGGSWRSPRHDEIFGYREPLAEWTYEDFLAHVHPGDRESVAGRFGRALETAAAWDFVCRIVRADDGEVRWIHGRGEPVLDAGGRPVRLIGVVRDVTAAHLAEAALRGARDEAEAANRAKSEFLAVMSHELRTPLNAIAGYTELLALGIHGPVNPGQVEALERISYSQKHLLRLINDVLNLARIEAGRVEYLIEDVDLDALARRVAPMVEPQAAAAGLRLEVAVSPGAAVRGDPDKIRQILLNLLGNAIKFTPPGGRVSVTSAVRRGAPGIVFLRVTDTGAGIPDDKQSAVFEPFVQVDMSRTRRTDGSGLGLAISRDLARGMGGDLRVRSVVGAGSTFTLTLPSA